MIDAKIKFFTSVVKGRRVLDVGVVQHSVAAFDFDTWLHREIVQSSSSCLGLDIDIDGVDELKRRGFNVIQGDAQDFKLGETFDIITAGDLIEHLHNFGGFLSSCKEHLREDGVVAISTPNVFWWKTFLHVLFLGDSNPHPEHTCWFCEKTLKQTLARHDFEIVELRYDSVYILRTPIQHLTRVLTATMLRLLPVRFRHNTILCVARVNR